MADGREEIMGYVLLKESQFLFKLFVFLGH